MEAASDGGGVPVAEIELPDTHRTRSVHLLRAYVKDPLWWGIYYYGLRASPDQRGKGWMGWIGADGVPLRDEARRCRTAYTTYLRDKRIIYGAHFSRITVMGWASRPEKTVGFVRVIAGQGDESKPRYP